MLVTHTFLDKSNTIIKGSRANSGLNPVISLYYGNLLTRALIHFDHSKLQGYVNDKTYTDISKLRHVLKFWNVSDINVPKINCPFPNQIRNGLRERATSFELIFFLLPKEWDAGRGFDYVEDIQPQGKHAYSEYGSNWFYSATDTRWETPGVYSNEFLQDEYDNPNSSVIIAKQHFDFGNEQLEVDITDTVNQFIEGTVPNYGIGIAFAPQYERMVDSVSQYAGFFSNRTNTFFEPYLETRYNDTIQDDRVDFFLDKPNKLYFYTNVGGNAVNLDVLPSCNIDGTPQEVKQATKGVYYIDIKVSSSDMQPDTMFYDTWTGIIYNGETFPDAELYTTTKSANKYMNFGLPFETSKTPKFKPQLYGIKDNENIKQGDIRRINVDCKINHTTNQTLPMNLLEYRLYVKTADRQIDVISWTACDRMYDTNVFYVDTNELLPQTYYVDIKAKYDREEIITRELLRFNVVSDGRKPE